MALTTVGLPPLPLPPSFLFHTCTELNQNCRLPATGRHPSEHCTHNKARFLGLLASKHKSETVAHGKKSFLQTIGVSFSVMNVHIAQRQASLDIKSTFPLNQRGHSRYTNENISLTDPIVRLLATRCKYPTQSGTASNKKPYTAASAGLCTFAKQTKKTPSGRD